MFLHERLQFERSLGELFDREDDIFNHHGCADLARAPY